MNYTAVITTINEPTKAVKEIAKRLPLIVIGDEKTPNGWKCEGVRYYNDHQILPEQKMEWFNYIPIKNHYANKNLGYLMAMQQGADCIYDTDDDNIPNDNWRLRGRECRAMPAICSGWVNVYSELSASTNLPVPIWPRGLPLNKINSLSSLSEPIVINSPIQQGLSDLSPDVDAIWRLIYNSKVLFKYERSVYLPPNTWSPFNSQSTWWFKEAFPLMYLPQYCSMRMTDIIRSFVAQRCLWEMGCGVVFHSPAEVIQERNEHDLLKDFEDEVQGYLMNDKIRVALDGIKFNNGKSLMWNMALCYLELVDIKVLPSAEIDSLNLWLKDIAKLWKP